MTAGPDATRRRAREAAFRVVYQSDVTHDSLFDAWESRRVEERLGTDGETLVHDLVHVLAARGPEVDGLIQQAAEHWEMSRLSATDRSVLRSAVAELLGRSGTPVRVVLDEAIEIAKRFGSEESGRFVNGVLDRVARSLRPAEF